MFCRYCGKEILEGASFCVHCGAMVGEVPFSNKSPVKIEKNDKVYNPEMNRKAKLSVIFGIVAFCCLSLTMLLTLVGIRIDDGEIGAIGWIISWAGLGFGITSFVLGCKQNNLAIKYMSTLIFIWSICWFIIPSAVFAD